MITVVTDVVRENNQTYRLGWTEQCKDGSKMGVGSPEYILLFHKPQTDRSKGYADTPIKKTKEDYSRARWQVDAHAFWRSSGDRLLSVEEMSKLAPGQLARVFTDWSLNGVYDYRNHVQIGEVLESRGSLPATFMAIAPGSHHPDVWHDVDRMDTMNTLQAVRGKQLHVCPLQFDIVDRLIERYSNHGEIVFDPFGGLMTVPRQAAALGRFGIGIDLNEGSWRDGVGYLKEQDIKLRSPSLFDFLEVLESEGREAG